MRGYAFALLGTVSMFAIGTGTGIAQTTSINGGGGTAAQPVYQAELTQFQSSNPQYAFTYVGTLSSTAQSAFLTNNATLLGEPTGTDVHFAASDRALSATQVSGYTLAAQDGPLIQVPMFAISVAIPFKNSKLTKGTQLSLTDAQLCSIYSGAVTDWSQISETAQAGPVAIYYRADSASTSFLFTQHLAAVCSTSQFTGTLAATSTFSSLFAGGVAPAALTGVTTTTGMQQAVLNSSSAIGYITSDYTSIAPKSGETSALIDASLVNATNKIAYQPSTGNMTRAIQNPGAGSMNSTPPSTQTAAANPLNWVPALPTPSAGYPIVGYGTWDVSTCYASANVTAGLIGFLKAHFNNAAYKTIILNNGGVPVANGGSGRFVSAIQNDFLGNASGYNLNIGNTTACAGLPGR